MYNIDRVCVYLGPDCNLSCRYCMRHTDTCCSWNYDNLSDHFADYLHNLDNNKVHAVIVTGGEPLLYVDRLQKVFATVPTNIHKKIITNGTLLDDAFVSYVNTNNIEVMLSHDGACSDYTRSIDILNDSNILALLKKIKHLTVSSTITNLNTDIEQIYDYIFAKLGKRFYLQPNVIYENGHNNEFIEEFNYILYAQSVRRFNQSSKRYIPPYYRYQLSPKHNKLRLNGINFNLNGDLINATTAEWIGHITDSNAIIEQRMNEQYPSCKNTNCNIRDICTIRVHLASEHTCRLHRQLREVEKLSTKNHIKTVYLMLGNECNFQCRHCVQVPMSAVSNTTISAKCWAYLDQIHSDKQKVLIHFWGGEPLLYFSTIQEVVDKFGNAFNYSIVSNGSLLTTEIVEFINEHNIRLAISNDGPNTESIRGINILDDSIIRDLFMQIKRRSINMILTAHSQDIRDCWQYFDYICPDTPVTLEFLMHTWDYPADLYAFDFDRLRIELEQIADKAVTDTISGIRSREVFLMEKYVYSIIQLAQSNNTPEFPRFPTCGQVVNVLNLDLDGNLYACHNTNDLIGRNGQDSYDELVAEYMAEYNRSFFPDSKCLECSYLAICRGGCPIESNSPKRSIFCQARKLFIDATFRYVRAFNDYKPEFIPTEFISQVQN